MRRLLNRLSDTEFGALLGLASLLGFACSAIVSCTPPRTIEHAPDLATETR